MRNAMDYKRKNVQPNWCPGCGNFGIDAAIKMALAKLDRDPNQTVLVGGIGCGSNLPYWSDTYGLVTLHGRPLPIAVGIKRANDALQVIVTAGDGDTYGIGMGHFIHAIRADVPIVCIVGNNGVYGLTKGQASPTAKRGRITPSTPQGAPYVPINPLALAMAAGGRFVARGYAGMVPMLADLIAEAMQYRGFALIDVLQPCVVYNKNFDYAYYQSRVVDARASGHDSGDKTAAFQLALMSEDKKIPIGVIYKETNATLEPVAGCSFIEANDIGDMQPLFEQYSQFKK